MKPYLSSEDVTRFQPPHVVNLWRRLYAGPVYVGLQAGLGSPGCRHKSGATPPEQDGHHSQRNYPLRQPRSGTNRNRTRAFLRHGAAVLGPLQGPP